VTAWAGFCGLVSKFRY